MSGGDRERVESGREGSSGEREERKGEGEVTAGTGSDELFGSALVNTRLVVTGWMLCSFCELIIQNIK